MFFELKSKAQPESYAHVLVHKSMENDLISNQSIIQHKVLFKSVLLQ